MKTIYAILLWPFAKAQQVSRLKFARGEKATRIRKFIQQYQDLGGQKQGMSIEDIVRVSLKAGALDLKNNAELDVCFRHLAALGFSISLCPFDYNWHAFLKYVSASGWKPGDSLAAEWLEMRHGGVWPQLGIMPEGDYPH